MNREQMIAWLTLEGWEYRPGNGCWLASAFKGNMRILYDEKWNDADVDNIDPYIQRIKFAEISPWEDATTGFIEGIFTEAHRND